MGEKPTNEDKWRWTLMTVVIFIIVVNPLTYMLMNGLFKNVGMKLSSATGCPTVLGLVIHTIVFTLLLRGIMEFDI